MRTPILSGLAFALPIVLLQDRVSVPATPAQPAAPALTTSTDPRTPIDETHTPGDADSLFRIDSPGSYYLRGNVLGEAGKSGIEIASNDVTIDLMGFQLSGVSGSLAGIRLAQGGNGLQIENGTVRGFGGDGLDLSGSRGAGLTKVSARSCAGAGMRLGDESLVDRCQAVGNAQEGIIAQSQTTLTHCLVTSNNREGVELDDHAIVIECILRGNQREGLQAGLGAIVRSCVASENGGVGILVSQQSLVSECSTGGNGDNGVQSAGGTVLHCSSANNEGNGIEVTGAANVLNNFLLQNGESGLRGAGLGATRAVGNYARLNGFHGINTVGQGNHVVQNAAGSNESGDYQLGSGFNGETGATASQATPWANAGF